MKTVIKFLAAVVLPLMFVASVTTVSHLTRFSSSLELLTYLINLLGSMCIFYRITSPILGGRVQMIVAIPFFVLCATYIPIIEITTLCLFLKFVCKFSENHCLGV